MAGQGMFDGVTDFSMKKTTKQAAGFYIVYLLIIVVLSMIGGLVSSINLAAANPNATTSSAFNAGVRIGTIIAILFVIILEVLILKGKGTFKDIISIVVALLAIILAFLGGSLLGLIPVAYLTTRESHNPQIR